MPIDIIMSFFQNTLKCMIYITNNTSNWLTSFVMHARPSIALIRRTASPLINCNKQNTTHYYLRFTQIPYSFVMQFIWSRCELDYIPILTKSSRIHNCNAHLSFFQHFHLLNIHYNNQNLIPFACNWAPNPFYNLLTYNLSNILLLVMKKNMIIAFTCQLKCNDSNLICHLNIWKIA